VAKDWLGCVSVAFIPTTARVLAVGLYNHTVKAVRTPATAEGKLTDLLGPEEQAGGPRVAFRARGGNSLATGHPVRHPPAVGNLAAAKEDAAEQDRRAV